MKRFIIFLILVISVTACDLTQPLPRDQRTGDESDDNEESETVETGTIHIHL